MESVGKRESMTPVTFIANLFGVVA